MDGQPGALSFPTAGRVITSKFESVLDARSTSVAVGVDGFPIFAYRNNSNGALYVGHCEDVACVNSTVVPPPPTSNANYADIEVGNDGLPVVSFASSGDNSVKLLYCTTFDCGNGTSVTLRTATAARATDLEFTLDGRPVVAIRTATNEAIVVTCNDPACTSTVEFTSSQAAESLALAIAATGEQVLVLETTSSASDPYKILQQTCAASGCTTDVWNTIDTVTIGATPDVAADSAGTIVVTYRNDAYQLALATCDSLFCDTPTLTQITDSGDNGLYSNVAVGHSGRLVISHRPYDLGGAMEILECQISDCAAPTQLWFDDTGDNGWWPDIAVLRSGEIVATYGQLPGTGVFQLVSISRTMW